MADEPLLQAFWTDVEYAAGGTEVIATPSATQLQQQYPNQLIQYLKEHGVKKLGAVLLPATDLPTLFSGATLLTRGSDSPTLDWSADWDIQLETNATPDTDVDEGVEPFGRVAGTLPDILPGDRGGWPRGFSRRKSSLQRYVLYGNVLYGRNTPGGSSGGGSAGTGDVAGGRGSSGGSGVEVYPRPTSSHRVQPSLSLAASAPAAPEAALPPPPSLLVEAYVVAVRDAAAPGEKSLLRPLLHRWQLGSCSASAFGLPAVQALVTYKWSRFARRLLQQQLAAYALWLGSFTAFMLLYNNAQAAMTDEQLLSTWQGRAAVMFELLALLAMLPFAAAELCIVRAYGILGWLSAWNLLDCATYGLQVAITVFHLGHFTNGPLWLMQAVAVQAILLVVRLTYFSRLFKSTNFDFMGSLQTVASEVGWYMAVLLLLMWGFACAFFTIFREDDATDSFNSLPMSLLTMLNYAVGGTSYYMRGLLASAQPAAAVALCTVYQFLVSMLLMSLLTGVMTNALMKANKQEAVGLMLNRAQVIDELETVLPQPLLRLLMSYPCTGKEKACSDSVWPTYVHVLRVNPRSLERIDGEERLWPAAEGSTEMSRTDSGDLPDRATQGGGGVGVAAPSAVTPADGPGGSSGGAVAAGHGTSNRTALERLETRVRQLEGQLADLHRTVRQLVDVNNDVRQLLVQQHAQK